MAVGEHCTDDELAALLRELALPSVAQPPYTLTRSTQRARGAYFTPAPLARFVAARVLQPLLAAATWRDGLPSLRVLDPAAGDGRFLVAAAEQLALAASARGASIDTAWRRAVATQCLIAIERDAAEAKALRARMPGLEVWTREALLDAPPTIGLVDAVVANPPYVRSSRLRESDPVLWTALRGRFAATSFGEWDLYAAFVERCAAWLRPGGRAGLLVPSRWLTARHAGPLRAHLQATGVVRAIVDFGATQVFADATTYASVLVLETTASSTAIATAVHDGATWHRNSLMPVPGTAPWSLRMARPWPRGPTLGDVARIVKGTGTNADRVFILPDAVVDGAHVVATIDGNLIRVEAAATRRCLRGRDVRSAGRDASAPQARCIVPYDVDGTLLSLAELRTRWPLAAAYLHHHRAALEARERGRFAGKTYTQFGRPQNLALHLGPLPRIVIPDVVAAPRAMLAAGATLIIDSAYAVYPHVDAGPHGDLGFLCTLLGSSVMAAWLRERSVPLRGGFTRMKTTALTPLPLPPAGPLLDAVIAAARAGDDRGAHVALDVAYA